MATNSSSDGEHAVAPIEHDEKAHSHAVQQVDAALDVDYNELPRGYFLRPFFLGTLLASGLSVSAVSNFSPFTKSLLTGAGRWRICTRSTSSRRHQQ
jgi:hypothetical protein